MTVSFALPFLLVAQLHGTPTARTHPHQTSPSETAYALVAKHCAGCHDADHAFEMLDPAKFDRDDWLNSLERVESGQMPPVEKKGTSVKDRFPLSPETRALLIESILKILGPAADPPSETRFMSVDGWHEVVKELTGGKLSKGELEGMLKSAFPSNQGNQRRMSPVYQMAIDVASEAACRVAWGEPPQAGTTPASTPPKRPVEEATHRILTQIYGDEPTEAELVAALKFVQTVREDGADQTESLVALCTHHLSGPKLWYGLYVGGKQ